MDSALRYSQLSGNSWRNIFRSVGPGDGELGRKARSEQLVNLTMASRAERVGEGERIKSGNWGFSPFSLPDILNFRQIPLMFEGHLAIFLPRYTQLEINPTIQHFRHIYLAFSRHFSLIYWAFEPNPTYLPGILEAFEIQKPARGRPVNAAGSPFRPARPPIDAAGSPQAIRIAYCYGNFVNVTLSAHSKPPGGLTFAMFPVRSRGRKDMRPYHPAFQ